MVEVTADIPLEPSCCNSSSDTDSACGRGGGEEHDESSDLVEGDDEAMDFELDGVPCAFPSASLGSKQGGACHSCCESMGCLQRCHRVGGRARLIASVNAIASDKGDGLDERPKGSLCTL